MICKDIITNILLKGLHFFGVEAGDPKEFVAAVKWWLGGTFRLGLVPALWLLIPEVCMRFGLTFYCHQANMYHPQALDTRARIWKPLLGLATELQFCICICHWLRCCGCRKTWAERSSSKGKMDLFCNWFSTKRNQAMDVFHAKRTND